MPNSNIQRVVIAHTRRCHHLVANPVFCDVVKCNRKHIHRNDTKTRTQKVINQWIQCCVVPVKLDSKAYFSSSGIWECRQRLKESGQVEGWWTRNGQWNFVEKASQYAGNDIKSTIWSERSNSRRRSIQPRLYLLLGSGVHIPTTKNWLRDT